MLCCCWCYGIGAVVVDGHIIAIWCPFNLRRLPARPLCPGGDRGLMVAESMGGNSLSYSFDPGVSLLMIDCFIDWLVPSSDVLV